MHSEKPICAILMNTSTTIQLYGHLNTTEKLYYCTPVGHRRDAKPNFAVKKIYYSIHINSYRNDIRKKNIYPLLKNLWKHEIKYDHSMSKQTICWFSMNAIVYSQYR